MGIYDSLTTDRPKSKQGRQGKVTHGGNSIASATALDSSGLITAMSDINWNSAMPEVASEPVLADVASADRAEDEARRYAISVDSGIRSMAATEEKLDSYTRLTRGYCKMLAKAGKSAAEILAARRALAGVLQEQRSIIAHLGHGLDRQIERTDTDVELIAAQYGRA